MVQRGVVGMVTQVWTAVRPHGGAQRFLWWCGTLLLASAVAHSVVAVVDGTPWLGSVSWRKPIVFGASFGLLAWSVVWVLRNMQRRWLRWPVVVLLGGFSVFEVALISMQVWRGQPSHFNNTSPFDEKVFELMGQSVLAVAAAIGLLLVWAVFDLRGSAVVRVAALAGITAQVVAGYIGTRLIAEGDAVVAATGHVPEDLVFGAAGSAKLAHAIGIHGIQVLAVLAILLEGTRLAPRARLSAMLIATVGYAGAYTAVTLTAYDGRPWTDPTVLLGVLGLFGVVGVAVGYLRALMARDVADERTVVVA
ncbi:hypothetical protein [Actinokineospora diospyrosa]|nr:hypothetical protein [Actinokineospora diospyrosa]